ncbi:hypothetical protein [Brevibacillus laterosporus]|uniref:hypothetical protein n=1 Tax=Brevibacillus laterosporus TaxID=1465 RepID=UPI00264C7EAF|nr:hypothetical protein [Brevibacillus laterosporus]MDN9011321.1 hypothetical protein [Brevibacillus laterosporus]MDO0942345.1 hypothetical protein [Brevibacillus laterosporus]
MTFFVLIVVLFSSLKIMDMIGAYRYHMVYEGPEWEAFELYTFLQQQGIRCRIRNSVTATLFEDHHLFPNKRLSYVEVLHKDETQAHIFLRSFWHKNK